MKSYEIWTYMVFDVRWGRSYHRVEKNAGPARRGDLAAESAGPGISLDPFWGLGGVTDCVCGNSDTNCALGPTGTIIWIIIL